MNLSVNERDEIAYLNTLEFVKTCLQNILNNSLFFKNKELKKEYNNMLIAINDLLNPNEYNYSSLFHYIKVENGDYYLNYDTKIISYDNIINIPTHFIITNNCNDIYIVKRIDNFNNYLIKMFKMNGNCVIVKRLSAKIENEKLTLKKGYKKEYRMINKKIEKIMHNL